MHKQSVAEMAWEVANRFGDLLSSQEALLSLIVLTAKDIGTDDEAMALRSFVAQSKFLVENANRLRANVGARQVKVTEV